MFDNRTVGEVFDKDFTKEQRNGLYLMIGLLLGMSREQQDVSMFLMGEAVKDARAKQRTS